MKEYGMTQHGKITYHQQVTYCGKPRCRRCREGIGHGPYWYAYQTINGQTTRSYIGKDLPSTVQAGLDTASVASGESFMAVNFSAFASHATHPSSAVEAENVVLRISTLGQFRLEQRAPARSKQKSRDGWRVVDTVAWQQRSVRALLAYLICSPGRRANRSQVIVALWPNDELATANSALNKTLNALRKVLGHPSVKSGEEHQTDSGERFATDGDWLLLAGQEHVWIDVDEFERLAQQIEEQGSQLPHYEDVLQRAIELYNGDFLPEERTAAWASSLRQRLRHKWIELLLKLSSLYVARKNHTGAINVLNNLLAKDPTNEQAIQQLIVVLMHQKRRIEAIQAYQRFEKTLQRNYKAAPSAEMRALYDAVCSGEGLPDIETLTDAYTLPSAAGGASSAVATPVQKTEYSPRSPHLFVPRSPSESIGRRHQGALIGREAELRLMRAMLQDVERNAHLQLVGARRASGIPLDTQRQPQLLLLRGDIGIGKTRLVEELGSAAQHEGWNIIWNRIYQQESGIPYRVWIEALRKILGTVSGLISQLSIETLRALSTLPGLLDLLPSGIDLSLPTALLLPEQAKYMLYNAICDLLKKASENGPLLIVLDDIQWADVSSYELLGHLARQLTGYTIIFFATCRVIKGTIDTPKPLRKLILEMQREHTIKTLDIEPLSSEQIKLLVTDISNLPEDMVAHIQVHAAGNPFFAEQLARSTPPDMPVTIKEALRYRMNQLRTECQDLLSRAAVLGGSFELPILCAMETDSGTDVSETVISLLDEAIDAGVLMDEGNGTRITYHFWHPLLDNYLYASTGRRCDCKHESGS
jgi:DNA-binding SARP family transcriptional activator